MGTQRILPAPTGQRFRSPAVIALSAALLVSCSNTIAGTPVLADVDIAALDVGSYRVEPLDLDNGSADQGTALEGLRMGSAIAIPSDIDESLTEEWYFDVTPTPEDAISVGAEAGVNQPVLTRLGMITGFYIRQGDLPAGTPNGTSIAIFLSRYPNESAAEQAAREVDQTDFAFNPDNRAVTIPNYPDAHAHWRPGIPSIGTLYAHGDMVVSLYLEVTDPDEQLLANRARDVLDAQVALLDDFQPTPVDQIASLPRDPDGMLRRTLIPRPSVQDAPSATTAYSSWSGHGVRHFRPGNPDWSEAWDSGGVDALGYAFGTMVFRFRDSEAADTFGDAWFTHKPANSQAIDSPSGLAQARCVETDGASAGETPVNCYVSRGRYGAIVGDRDSTLARQQAAAQYALLVNTE